MKWRVDSIFSGAANNGIMSVAIGDIDGDGANEVVFGQESGNLKRVKWIGNSWNVSQIDSQGGIVYDIAIGDADNNGITDIIFARYRYVFRTYWNGSSWVINQIYDVLGGISNRCLGVAIGDFDSSFPGNEIVAVTYEGKVARIRWNGSSWENYVMYNNSDCRFYDPAIGDFDTSNLGNEIVFGNAMTTLTYGSLIELYGWGTNWITRKIYTPIGNSEPHQNLAIGDVLDEHMGLEIVSIGTSNQVYVRVIYGSGVNWLSQVVTNFPLVNAYGVVIGDVNKYRSYNQEIVFARNTILYEAEQRLPPGPTLTNISHNPIIPLFNETVTVKAKILDTLTITADSLYYAINTQSNWQPISHSNLDSFYYYTIPNQDTGTIVYYFLRAKNISGGERQSPIFSYQVAYEHSVYQIQYTLAPSGSSPDTNKLVHTKGIVTSVFGRFFNLEEEPGGAWHGIHIRRPAFSDTSPSLAIGDSVTVLGRVIELANQTVINVFYDSGGRTQKISSAHSIPCTTITRIPQIAESLEGTLVRVDTVRFKATGIFQLNTTYWIYNFAETESITVFIRSETNIPTESIPQGFLLLTGCVNQYINNYQIVPRAMNDLNLLPVDFGVTEILVPPDTVNYGDSIIPEVVIKNFALTPVINLTTWLHIGTTYNNERFFPKLAAKSLDTVEFAWWRGNAGQNRITAYTRLRNDLNPQNDTTFDSVYVRLPAQLPDVGVTTIIPSYDTISASDTLFPKVEIKNFSNTSGVNFFVYLKIERQSSFVYLDSLFIPNLGPLQIDTIQFRRWLAIPGTYSLISFTVLSLDSNPSNDTAYGSLYVQSVSGFWQQRKSMPLGAGKNVKQGGALVYTRHDTIYAFKGSNTCEFYAYNITTDSWVRKESIPMLSARPKRLKRGAALTYDKWNEKIYALKGNNTREFWQYDLIGDTWHYIGEVPSADGKKVKGGAALSLVKKGLNYYVYFMKGTKSTEFYAFDASVSADTWIKGLKPIPLLPSGKPMKDGSCMVHSDTVLFCLKGGYNDFYAYSIAADTWYIKKSLPMIGASNRKKKVKDGASLCYDETRKLVYALKGGNTQEFWAYQPDLDTWIELETIPRGLSNKRVKSGGALTFADGLVFALKGNNTRELWQYTPGSSIRPEAPQPICPDWLTLDFEIEKEESRFQISNPTKDFIKIQQRNVMQAEAGVYLTFKLYNITGALIKSGIAKPFSVQAGIYQIEIKDLPSGVYILRLDSDNMSLTRKIVRQK